MPKKEQTNYCTCTVDAEGSGQQLQEMFLDEWEGLKRMATAILLASGIWRCWWWLVDHEHVLNLSR